jgi:hypothetical protein
MPPVGLEPTIPVFERPKMVHALDRAATVAGHKRNNDIKMVFRKIGKAKLGQNPISVFREHGEEF